MNSDTDALLAADAAAEEAVMALVRCWLDEDAPGQRFADELVGAYVRMTAQHGDHAAVLLLKHLVPLAGSMLAAAADHLGLAPEALLQGYWDAREDQAAELGGSPASILMGPWSAAKPQGHVPSD